MLILIIMVVSNYQNIKPKDPSLNLSDIVQKKGGGRFGALMVILKMAPVHRGQIGFSGNFE